MFDGLSDRLASTAQKLRGEGRLTENNIQDALRDVRMALLEADVALSVVRDFIEEVEHPVIGRVKIPGAPFKMHGTPWQQSPAPLLGHHNKEIYGDCLGYSGSDLIKLAETGVI